MTLPRRILGALLLAPNRVEDARKVLAPEDFSEPPQRAIYSAMLALSASGVAVTDCNVAEALERQGADKAAVAEIQACILAETSSAYLKSHMLSLSDEGKKRRAVALIREAVQAIESSQPGSGDVGQAIQSVAGKLYEVAYSGASKTTWSLREAAEAAIEESDRIEAAGGAVRTGFRHLDGLTGGSVPGDLFVIGARPSCGKTTLGLNICERLASSGDPALLYSLEMFPPALGMRALANRADIEGPRFRSGLSDDERSRAVGAAIEFARWPLWIEQGRGATIQQVAATARKVRDAHGLRLLVVDYLQLIHARAGSRVEEIGYVTRGLKDLAGEVECPVIALAQLNREFSKRHDQDSPKPPKLTDLKGSGDIEQDADVVVLLWEGRQGLGYTGGILAKNRQGRRDIEFHLKWDRSHFRMENANPVGMEI